MRIISGKLRGRRPMPPKDRSVRPTSDMVKEAIFSMISPYIDEDSIVVDLFSGTGNLGLEAISRGAKFVYFGDKSRDSIKLTRDNVAYCKVQEQAQVIQGDFRQVLSRVREKVDIFFLDPPYREGLVEDAILAIRELDLLNEGGIIVAEHDKREVLPETLHGYILIKDKIYSSIGITIYKDEEQTEE